MGVMPLSVDNSVETFVVLKAKLNEGLVNGRVPEGSAGDQLRDAIITKLKGEWGSNDPDLLSNPLFWEGLQQPAQQGSLHATVKDQVYDHFQQHWGNSSQGWFPSIKHNRFKRVLTRGFLAALLRARWTKTPQGQLPVEIVWICSSPDPDSPEVNVEHFVSDCQLVLTIATPIPSHLVGHVASPTAVVLETYKKLFEKFAGASVAILSARIEHFEQHETEYGDLGVDVGPLVSELTELLESIPPTYDRAEAIDADAEKAAARARIAIESVPSLDERVADGVDPDGDAMDAPTP